MSGRIKSLNTDVAEQYYICRVVKEYKYDIDKSSYTNFEKVNNITILYIKGLGERKNFYIRLIKSDNIDDSYYFEEDIAEQIKKLGNNQFTDDIFINDIFFKINDLAMNDFQYDVYNCAKKREGYISDSEEEDKPLEEYETDCEAEDKPLEDYETKSKSNKLNKTNISIYKKIKNIGNKEYYNQVERKEYDDGNYSSSSELVCGNYKYLFGVIIFKIEKKDNNYNVVLLKSSNSRGYLRFKNDIVDELSKNKYNDSKITLILSEEFFKVNNLKMKDFNYNLDRSDESDDELPNNNICERNTCKYKTEKLKDTRHVYDRQVEEKIYKEVIPEKIHNYTNIIRITVIMIKRIDDNNYKVVLIKGSNVRDQLNFRNDIADELLKDKYNDSKITLTLDDEFFKYNYIKMYEEFDYDFDISKDTFNEKYVNEHNSDIQEQFKRDKERLIRVAKPRLRKICTECNVEESKKDRKLCNKCLYKKEKEKDKKEYVKCYFCYKMLEKNPIILANHFVNEHVEKTKKCSECETNDREPNRTVCKECYNEKCNEKINCNYCNKNISKKNMKRHIEKKHP